MSSSMAFPLTTCPDANLNSHIHRPHGNQVRSEAAPSCIKISRHPQIKYSQQLEQITNEKKKPCLLKRREAIKLGICFGVVEALFNQIQPSWAVVEEGTSSCELTVTPSGLAFCDKVVGYGAEAVKGQLIKAHYVGKLENGKVFDSSYNRGKPLTFRIGVGEVIKGWDQGIIGGDGVPPMLAGGKRILKLPPELGYGKRGAGCKGGSCIIPPDATLLFDVEFIGKT